MSRIWIWIGNWINTSQRKVDKRPISPRKHVLYNLSLLNTNENYNEGIRIAKIKRQSASIDEDIEKL